MRKISNFIESTFVAIGYISSFVTIFWAFLPNNMTELANKCPVSFLIGLFILSLIFAYYTNRSKNKIKLNLSDHVKAKIFFGDLFESNEIIVIPVNEYFDLRASPCVAHRMFGCPAQYLMPGLGFGFR